MPFSDNVDATGATAEIGEPSPGCFGANKSLWYAFTPSSTGSYTASSNLGVAIYTGASLTSLTQLGCRNGGPVTFHADVGTTYFVQEGWYFGGFFQFNLAVAPNPNASFFYYSSTCCGDPSVFDTVQLVDQSYDPGGMNIAAEDWAFGDGASGSGYNPTHRYGKDGDYTVKLTVTTTDGRTSSTTRVIHVATHDVTIAKVSVPQSVSSGQTRSISVGVTDSRYPENVQVQLLKSTAAGWAQVGTLTQSVPVRGSNRTTDFAFSYTFTTDDAALGKVSFRAVASIQNARDALPADNDVTALPAKVSR